MHAVRAVQLIKGTRSIVGAKCARNCDPVTAISVLFEAIEPHLDFHRGTVFDQMHEACIYITRVEHRNAADPRAPVVRGRFLEAALSSNSPLKVLVFRRSKSYSLSFS